MVVVTEWLEFRDSKEDWDRQLTMLPNPTVYQGHGWGEHRGRFGWTPRRFIAHQGSRVVAMVQANVRTYGRFAGVAWMPGGPIGDLSVCDESLRSTIARSVGLQRLVMRINPDRPFTEADAAALHTAGWSKSRRTLLSGSTMHYRLDLTNDERLALLSRNWRHNLRRGQKRELRVDRWAIPSPEDIARAYDAMNQYKGLDQFSGDTSTESIASIIAAHGDNCVVVRCEDNDGTLLAVRGALILGNRAWDTFAAATPAGRKNYASYLAFWKLTELCAERGVMVYDMGGIDPITNRGVYDFKQGTGATAVSLLGEWEHARPKVLGTLVSRRIARRQG